MHARQHVMVKINYAGFKKANSTIFLIIVVDVSLKLEYMDNIHDIYESKIVFSA